MIINRYLGNGVYASFDGYRIWLDLRGQREPNTRIALEPEVLMSLFQFNKDLMNAIDATADSISEDAEVAANEADFKSQGDGA